LIPEKIFSLKSLYEIHINEWVVGILSNKLVINPYRVRIIHNYLYRILLLSGNFRKAQYTYTLTNLVNNMAHTYHHNNNHASANRFAKRDQDVVQQKTGRDNTFVFDPYNSLNNEITPNEVIALLKKHNVHVPIHNFTLYKRAFVHKSYIRRPQILNDLNNITIAPKPDNCTELYTKSNERLEFLGDGVLECIAKFYLYKRFPKADEGFMTDTKIELVKNETIGRIANDIGLAKWFMISKHTEQKKLRGNHKKLGCLFEAFVGALFLDFNRVAIHDEEHWFDHLFKCGPGFQVAQLFVEHVFDTYIDWTKITKQSENYKRPVQELLQSEFKVTPHLMEIKPYSTEYGYNMGVYMCIGQKTYGVKHEDTITHCPYHSFQELHHHLANNHSIYLFLGEGTHKTKQMAEQIACRCAIELFKEFHDFQETVDKIQQKHTAFSRI
jgi:ribonuclease III